MISAKRAATIGVIWCSSLFLVTLQPAFAYLCPTPPPCAAPTVTCGAAQGHPGFVNSTTASSLVCSGATAAGPTISVTTIIGPANLCYGTQLTQSCSIPFGGQDIDTLVQAVFVNAVAIPTLSVWGLGALVAGMGALALRRLRLRSGAG